MKSKHKLKWGIIGGIGFITMVFCLIKPWFEFDNKVLLKITNNGEGVEGLSISCSYTGKLPHKDIAMIVYSDSEGKAEWDDAAIGPSHFYIKNEESGQSIDYEIFLWPWNFDSVIDIEWSDYSDYDL